MAARVSHGAGNEQATQLLQDTGSARLVEVEEPLGIGRNVAEVVQVAVIPPFVLGVLVAQPVGGQLGPFARVLRSFKKLKVA